MLLTASITIGVIFWSAHESHAVRKEVAFLSQEQLYPSDAKPSVLRLARLDRATAIAALEKAWQEHPGEPPNPPQYRLGLIIKWLKAGLTAEEIERGYEDFLQKK